MTFKTLSIILPVFVQTFGLMTEKERYDELSREQREIRDVSVGVEYGKVILNVFMLRV